MSSTITTQAQEGSRGGASLDSLAIITGALPTALITRIARQQAQTVDFATSNVRAAPVPVYIAGAQLLENYAVGPLLGVAFNLTLLSYNGHLEMGINIDAAAVEEPARLGRAGGGLVQGAHPRRTLIRPRAALEGAPTVVRRRRWAWR